jgi:hypothetical protein
LRLLPAPPHKAALKDTLAMPLISWRKATMFNQSYTADSPKKQREILLENAIATYWDGYDGKP